MSATIETAEAVTFLNDVFGDTPSADARIALWTKSTKRSDYLTSAAEAERFEGRADVYVTAALVGPVSGGRSEAADAVAIPGVWADIDVVGGPEDPDGKLLAPDAETALQVAGVDLEPSLVVHSGYGLQAWWLFEEPWLFRGADDRERAAELSKRWQARLRTNALELGFGLDSTHDLARLMRLPGTFNDKGPKGTKRPAQIHEQGGTRYSFEEIAEIARAAAPTEQPQLPSSNGKAELPRAKFDALVDNVDGFEATWEHTRELDGKDQSLSAYDLAVASFAAHRGWTLDELPALIAAHRRKHGDPQGKAERPDYLQRTAARALQGVDEPAAPVEPVAFDSKTGKPITKIESLNKVIGDQGGTAEILSVKQVGQQKAKWYFAVKSERADEPAELESLTTKQLRNLANLAERVMEADGGEFPTPRAGSEKHGALMKAIQAAKEFEEHGATEEGTWRHRLVQYLRRFEPVRRDLADTDEKRSAVEDPNPFEAEGRLWVSSGHWLEHLEFRRVRDADAAAVQSALRQMGFESMPQLTSKVGGRVQTQRYWRAPTGFDWAESA